MKLTSYLIFNGQAEQAANFYADLLSGEICNFFRYDSMPAGEGMPEVPEECKNRVLHACVGFPGGSLSLADTLPNVPCDFGNGGHALNLSCDSVEEIENAYAKLCDGATKIQCELAQTYFANRYAEVVDRFGVLWALIYVEN